MREAMTCQFGGFSYLRRVANWQKEYVNKVQGRPKPNPALGSRIQDSRRSYAEGTGGRTTGQAYFSHE